MERPGKKVRLYIHAAHRKKFRPPRVGIGRVNEPYFRFTTRRLGRCNVDSLIRSLECFQKSTNIASSTGTCCRIWNNFVIPPLSPGIKICWFLGCKFRRDFVLRAAAAGQIPRLTRAKTATFFARSTDSVTAFSSAHNR